MASLKAVVKSISACLAMGPPACTLPLIVAGGKPVIAVPGKIPTLPVMRLGPVLVTVEPARIAKYRALRSLTDATAGCIAESRCAEFGPTIVGVVEFPAPHA